MSTYPDYSGLPNYGRRSLAPSRPTYRPWTIAVLATGIGLVVSLVLGLVVGFFGGVAAVAAGLAGAPESSAYVGAALVFGTIYLGTIFVQARFVRTMGGARPWLACFAAFVASLVVTDVLGLVVGGPVIWILSVAAQVATIALITDRQA